MRGVVELFEAHGIDRTRLLGYGTTNEFGAACKRWFTMEPARYRRWVQTGTATS
ncbi:hypothetical protein [Caenimonas sedimenti]|uniref:hypothetical protein n=1 Tax=Caenimonas sedimenti TaxID=2596921 RepID=UPI001644A1D6|nr:hypothetical protein [Caenimonas sedimenti]